jgi:hypothetical protein
MKSMKDRSMDMNKGGVDSDGYFPSEAKHKILSRPGEIRNIDYPDTEEATQRDIRQAITETSKNLPKPGFRH